MAGGTHLELEERERLAAPEAEGLSLRAIARQLGRAASTISRELRRNALPKGGYRPGHAPGCPLARLPAGARGGRPPGAPPAPGRPRARRAARPLRARAPAGRLDPRADRRLARAGRGARARSSVGRGEP